MQGGIGSGLRYMVQCVVHIETQAWALPAASDLLWGSFEAGDSLRPQSHLKKGLRCSCILWTRSVHHMKRELRHYLKKYID